MSTAADEARGESARQAVMFIGMAIAIPLLVWWERKMSGPDAMSELGARVRRMGRGAGRQLGEDAALRELHRDIARFEGKVP